MDDRNGPLRPVIEAPYEDGPRLAFADWCGGQSDAEIAARGEYIRIEINHAREPFNSSGGVNSQDPMAEAERRFNWLGDSERAGELWETHGRDWRETLLEWGQSYSSLR